MLPLLGFIASLCSSPGQASTVHVEGALHASPVVLAGTLAPATLSVNGNPVSIRGETARALKLNGASVETHTDDVHSFHLTSDAGVLELSWTWDEGRSERIARLSYPAIDAMTVSPAEAKIRVNESTRSLSADGVEIPLSDGTGRIEINSISTWLAAEHSLELKDAEGGSRLYTLGMEGVKDDVLSDWDLGFGITGSASGTGKAYQVELRRAWPSRWSAAVAPTVAFLTEDPTPTGGTFTRNAYELKLRGGYDPFHSGLNWIDPRRLTLGLVFVPFVDYISETNSGFAPPSTTTFHAELGWFFRFEPFRWKDFGIVANMDIFAIRALRPFDFASISSGIELCKHW